MKIRHGIVLVLLLGLVASAAAAGDPIPVLPHEFYGGVTIAGSPAPAGTVITATIGGAECGSVQTVEAGRYGYPDRRLGGRLDVTATADQAGETITFFVNGVAAQETATFASGAATALDLSVAAESTPTPTPTPGSSGGGGSSTGSGGGGGGGSSKDPGSQLVYDPDAPEMHTGHAPLATSAAGVVLETVTVRTVDETCAVAIREGTTARDADGNPLGEVTTMRIAPADVPAVPPGTTVAIALSCGPEGATFDPPAVLTYTLSKDEWERIDRGATPKVMWYNPETKTWQDVASTVDPDTRKVTAQVSHFSTYALAWTVSGTTEPETQDTPTPEQKPVQEPGSAFPTWALALVVVLVVALAAFLVMRKK